MTLSVSEKYVMIRLAEDSGLSAKRSLEALHVNRRVLAPVSKRFTGIKAMKDWLPRVYPQDNSGTNYRQL